PGRPGLGDAAGARGGRSTLPDARGSRGDPRLSLGADPIAELGEQPDILERGREDPSAGPQDVVRTLHRAEKVVLQMAEGREDQVPEAVAPYLLLVVAVEAEVEDRRQRRIAVGQRQQTVPDVAGRAHPVRAPQAPRAAPIVRGGDDRGEALPSPVEPPPAAGRKERCPETPKQEGQARPPAEPHDPHAST